MINKKENLSLLIKWSGKNRIYLFLSLICSIISGFSTIIPYFIVYQIIDLANKNVLSRKFLVRSLIVLSITILIRFILLAISRVLSHKGTSNTMFKIHDMLIKHMAKIPLGYLNKRNIEDIKTLLSEDVEKIKIFLDCKLPKITIYIIGFVFIFLYLVTINRELAMISLIPVIISVVAMILSFRKTNSVRDLIAKPVNRFNMAVIEYVKGMRLIKTYSLGDKAFAKYSNAVKEDYDDDAAISIRKGPICDAHVMIVECGLFLIVPVGGMWFLKGSIVESTLIFFMFVGSLYLFEFRVFQEIGSSFAQLNTSITKCREFLETPIFKGKDEFPKKSNISIKDMSFSYDGKREVLKKVNLEIQEGKRIAFVGVSGSGKSTISQLISRFYDIRKGKITIGGKDIRDIDYNELLKNISIVFQKTFLKNGSILENITMKSEFTLEEVREAARKAQIDEFIISLPEGYYTNIENSNCKFSEGEKQRIAIARAILKNSKILILDEATLISDPEDQMKTDNAIEELCARKTVIVVAHKLEIAKKCDKIAVVANKTISYVGTHEEALLKNRYYKKAWQKFNKANGITYRLIEGDN